MDMNEQLAQEWTTLQNNHESQERSALVVKLVAVVLFAGTWLTGLDPLMGCALVLILWFQEAILKTWQSRLASRLLGIEAMIKRGAQNDGQPFQLHSHWLAQRPGLAGLLIEYGQNAIRPTVAFPYGALLLLAVIL
ncbi:hypothetical protein [Rhodoferax sp.]|uniref:hypothetical protein n=1 Tax=Rhodoferax sp. TaxID=50421 RepID=UPI002722603D|nr:hypothetical protein [Rhodoferax sp.]MDO9198888.1 hypothetical protein [Rhodoferax sp.]